MIPCIDPATTGFDVPLADYLEAASRSGFRAVEFSIVKAAEFIEGRPSHTLNALAASLHLELGQFTCGTGIPSNITVSEAAFGAGLRRWRDNCELASALGCKRASILVNSIKGDGFEEPGTRLSASEIIERLKRLADIAAQYGVFISVEFVDRDYLRQAGEILQRVEAANVGLLLDTFNLYDIPDPLSYLSRLPPGMISWIQIADAEDAPAHAASGASATQAKPQRTLPGMGRLNLHAILEACRRCGYEGHVSVEVYGDERLSALPLRAKTERAAHSILAGELASFFNGWRRS